MNYTRNEAKDYAREHFAASGRPPHPVRRHARVRRDRLPPQLRHWVTTLGLGGLFVAGKQGEFFSMSVEERKRSFEIAVETAAGRCGIVTSCSDRTWTWCSTWRGTRRRSAPTTSSCTARCCTSRTIPSRPSTSTTATCREQLDIGIALWNHPDCGYLMSPELCARIADLPNVVAIKYSVDRAATRRLTELAGDRIHVSTASEEEWLDNIVELGWRLYLCSTPPFLLQTAVDQRINDYTRLAFAGTASARPARCATASSPRARLPQGAPRGHCRRRTPSTGRSCWARSAGRRGGRCCRSPRPSGPRARRFARSGLRAA
jgi:4-hydroxy-tetrahydrodipicolinate synthase